VSAAEKIAAFLVGRFRAAIREDTFGIVLDPTRLALVERARQA